jgi:nicotinate-nucleotide adenylyltransferase
VNVYLFGGSFNPPHVAHVLAVSYLLATQDVDSILVVPCFLHPFAKELAPFEDRMAMCERAMGWLPKTTISRVEEELGGESRTLRTVEHLHAQHPDWRLRLVVGSDILLEGRRWHGFDRVVQLAPLLVLGRVGAAAPQSPAPILPEVSSTAIREAIRGGRRDEVESLVPRAVLSYIDDHRIYREGA